MKSYKDALLDFFGINIASDRARWVKKNLLALPRGLRILAQGRHRTRNGAMVRRIARKIFRSTMEAAMASGFIRVRGIGRI